MNELLFCKLISNTIYIYIYMCVCARARMRVCVHFHVRKCDVKCNFCPSSS